MSCGGVSELVIERRVGGGNSVGGGCRLRGTSTATANATAITTATPPNATTKEVSTGKAGAGAPSGEKNTSTTASSTGKDLTVAQAPAQPSRPTKPCCFCWCCCCSCSCVQKIVSLAVKNVDENGPTKKTENSDLLNCDGEPPPSLDEIRSWGKSFDKLMRSSAGRKVFRDFLRCEYSEENILFWLACEELKRETNPDVVEEKARKIYEDYISILSPKEVSLDSRVREIVNRNMVEPTPHTFDEAQLQIYTLMHRDSYPRFVNSSLFKTLAQLNSSGASDAGSNADPAEHNDNKTSASSASTPATATTVTAAVTATADTKKGEDTNTNANANG